MRIMMETGFLPALFRVLSEEVVGQQQYVLSPFPQRRDHKRYYSQPVIQILPEQAFFDQSFQIPVGRADKPDVNLVSPVTADRADFSVLNGVQQLHLQRHAQVANLVEKQCTPVRCSEKAYIVGNCAAERPADVTEQF